MNVAVFGVVAIVLVATIAGLVLLVTRGAENRGRTAGLLAALSVAVIVTLAIVAWMSIYYVKPVGWIAATVAAVLSVLALAFLAARDLGWKPVRLLGVFAVGLLSLVLFVAFAMSGVIEPPFRYGLRAEQIGEKHGFTAMLPAGEKMNTGSLPVDAIADPENGLLVSYEGFELREWGSRGVKSAEELRRYLTPSDYGPVPWKDSQAETLTVAGNPALALDFSDTTGPKVLDSTLVVFQKDGLVVRVQSQGFEQMQGNAWVVHPGLDRATLIGLADELVPAK